VAETIAEEVDMMRHLTDCLGYLLKAERAAFVPVLDQMLLPLLEALLGQDANNPATLVSNAICLFDDAIEVRVAHHNPLDALEQSLPNKLHGPLWQHCGPAASKYVQLFFPIALRSIERTLVPSDQSEDEEDDRMMLRQACLYGVTQVKNGAGRTPRISTNPRSHQAAPWSSWQVAKHAPEYLDGALLPMRVLETLVKILHLQDRNKDTCRAATENAVSALMSICQGGWVHDHLLWDQWSHLSGRKHLTPSPAPPGLLSRRMQVALPAGAEVTDLLSLCVSHLPLYDDVIEAQVVHRQLAALLETQAQAVLGADGRHAKAVLHAVAEIIKLAEKQRGQGGEEDDEEQDVVADKHTLARLAGAVQQLSQGPAAQVR
jgi:hypothetical protein